MNGKRRSKAGESIAETLISMLIVAVTCTFLAGAVVSAARVNTRLEGQDVTFHADSSTTVTDYTITVFSGLNELKKPDDTVYRPEINLYQTENGYYYYEVETIDP